MYVSKQVSKLVSCLSLPAGTTRVSRCQKRTSGLMVQRKINRGRHRPPGWAPLHPDQPVPTSTMPPFFYWPDALPAAQPTVSNHWRILYKHYKNHYLGSHWPLWFNVICERLPAITWPLECNTHLNPIHCHELWPASDVNRVMTNTASARVAQIEYHIRTVCSRVHSISKCC